MSERPLSDHVPAAKSGSDQKNVLHALLSEGLADLEIDLSQHQLQQLLSYQQLLSRWNKVVNLTAVRNPAEMISRHLLDALSILPVIRSHLLNADSTQLRILDMGSGAGLPGIPLAIADSRLEVTMVDSAARKTRFIRQAIAELNIANATVIHSRVEDLTIDAFPCLVARAFSTPVDIINKSGHLCTPGGCFVLMMAHTGDKLDHLPSGYKLKGVKTLNVPNETALRTVALCKRCE